MVEKRRRLNAPDLGWQVTPESVAGQDRNAWQVDSGISGRSGPEWVATTLRKTQIISNTEQVLAKAYEVIK